MWLGIITEITIVKMSWSRHSNIPLTKHEKYDKETSKYNKNIINSNASFILLCTLTLVTCADDFHTSHPDRIIQLQPPPGCVIFVAGEGISIVVFIHSISSNPILITIACAALRCRAEQGKVFSTCKYYLLSLSTIARTHLHSISWNGRY